MSMIQLMARTLFKTSGCGCSVNFYFSSLYLRCLVDDFECRVCASKFKIDKISSALGE